MNEYVHGIFLTYQHSGGRTKKNVRTDGTWVEIRTDTFQTKAWRVRAA
jgi:hypothetical protein